MKPSSHLRPSKSQLIYSPAHFFSTDCRERKRRTLSLIFAVSLPLFLQFIASSSFVQARKLVTFTNQQNTASLKKTKPFLIDPGIWKWGSGKVNRGWAGRGGALANALCTSIAAIKPRLNCRKWLQVLFLYVSPLCSTRSEYC